MVKKVKRKKSGIPISILFLLIVSMLFIINIFPIYQKEFVFFYNDFISLKNQSQETESETFLSLNPENLYSTNVTLVRLKDNKILFQKKSKEKIYPASLTKIMTAIVAIENLDDLNEEITLTHYTFDGLYSSNASMAGFQPGEKVRAIDLLYGVLLPSGAEACRALAEKISGSEEGFVELMNLKALELGMENSFFSNTTGLHDENHFTTADDLAVLLNYALKNSTFRDIFTTSSYSIHSTNKHPEGMTFKNTIFKKGYDMRISGGEILGGKTGFTAEAGLCLASLAIKDGLEYILITTGAKGDQNTEQYNVSDALKVFNKNDEK